MLVILKKEILFEKGTKMVHIKNRKMQNASNIKLLKMLKG